MNKCIVFLLLCLLLQAPSLASADLAAPATVAVPSTEQDVSEDSKAVQEAWEALLATHSDQLAELKTYMQTLKDELPTQTSSIRQNTTLLRQEFDKLNTLSQVKGGMPSDLTVLMERFNRIKERLSVLTQPVQDTLGTLARAQKAVDLLETSLASQSGPLVSKELKKNVTQTQKTLKELKERYELAITPSNELSSQIQGRIDSLAQQMPTLWKNHYFQSSGHFYDVVAWVREFRNLGSLRELFSLRLTTELPNTGSECFYVLLRIISTMGFFLLLMAAIRKPASTLPAKMRGGVKRIMRNSLIWIMLGIAIHTGAWSGGKLYQMIAALGTMCLCWGQMMLAWDLYEFENVDRPRLSPLWPMFPPLFIGMILLNFDPFPVFIAVVWVFIQGVDLWLAYRRQSPEGRLPNVIMQLYTIQLWIALIISLFGFARLSILMSMAFTSIAVTSMLCVSLFKVENLIEEHLPSEGTPSILASLVMALVMPIVLLAATLASVLWIFAYPGGSFLIQHLASLGFNVGDVSLNAMQILSIFIAFYLTRTMLRVGNTFMTGMQSQISRISVSLLAPIQVIYKCVLWGIFGLYALNALGFNLSSLTVIAGGLSVGIGLGMQSMVQEFTSGLSVIFGQTIREGDVVEVGAITGTVKKINIRNTMLQTFDNAIVFIPNTAFLSGTFINWTHNDRKVRKEIMVGVAYGSDVDLCTKLMLDIAKAHPQVLFRPAPMVLFMNFGPSSLDLVLRFWTSYDNGATVMSEVRQKINQVFAANGIEISFPQMDLHLRTGGITLPQPDVAAPKADTRSTAENSKQDEADAKA